ncbi:MAG TPA: tripartite tricarboxylate transporter TctB family protein [candidate division Zixibacteria bacterium]|nr:tripartite tricarboxylate transporter TctB family protein [candidate division Zixibacteria bacterium]
MIRSKRDFWAGLIYIFFGAAALVVARDYDMGTALKMGPAYFPTILGALLLLVGAIAVVRSFIVSGLPVGAFAVRHLALIVASVLLFGYILRGAGVAVAVPVLVISSGFASRRFRWVPTIFLAAGLALFCVLIFLKGLGVPLPVVGPWFGD